jgi:hypothetical protein
MQNDQAGIFGRRGNQQVGDLSAVLASAGKHALNLAGALYVARVGFHQTKRH